MYKKFIGCKIIVLLFIFSFTVIGQTRKEISIPDIPGYLTLKCDFHMHTPFSDGTVWPPDRVTEAWIEGLDAIAITDHVEYHAYSSDVKIRPNRAYELALPKAKQLGLLLIHAAEITRDMPPGHLNALFISNDSSFTVKDPMKALEEAAKQNAFIFWNHPGWKGQQKDGVARWYDEHTTLYEKGWMKGIEIVNSGEYYPEVYQWAIEKKLPLMGNSDIHSPIAFSYDKNLGQHRPLTLVFAKDRTTAAIREALEAGRTAVYFKDKIFGHEEELTALFSGMVEVKNPKIALDGSNKTYMNLHNHSDIDMVLKASGNTGSFKGPGTIELPAHLTVRIAVKIAEESKVHDSVILNYEVLNLFTGPERNLSVQLTAKVVNP